MIKAKKNLGQNFLIDNNILEKITNATDIFNKTILEIGPGTGNLTSYILKKNPKNMFVIEKAETGQFLRREAIMLKTRKKNSWEEGIVSGKQST